MQGGNHKAGLGLRVDAETRSTLGAAVKFGGLAEARGAAQGVGAAGGLGESQIRLLLRRVGRNNRGCGGPSDRVERSSVLLGVVVDAQPEVPFP